MALVFDDEEENNSMTRSQTSNAQVEEQQEEKSDTTDLLNSQEALSELAAIASSLKKIEENQTELVGNTIVKNAANIERSIDISVRDSIVLQERRWREQEQQFKKFETNLEANLKNSFKTMGEFGKNPIGFLENAITGGIKKIWNIGKDIFDPTKTSKEKEALNKKEADEIRKKFENATNRWVNQIENSINRGFGKNEQQNQKLGESSADNFQKLGDSNEKLSGFLKDFKTSLDENTDKILSQLEVQSTKLQEQNDKITTLLDDRFNILDSSLQKLIETNEELVEDTQLTDVLLKEFGDLFFVRMDTLEKSLVDKLDEVVSKFDDEDFYQDFANTFTETVSEWKNSNQDFVEGREVEYQIINEEGQEETKTAYNGDSITEIQPSLDVEGPENSVISDLDEVSDDTSRVIEESVVDENNENIQTQPQQVLYLPSPENSVLSSLDNEVSVEEIEPQQNEDVKDVQQDDIQQIEFQQVKSQQIEDNQVIQQDESQQIQDIEVQKVPQLEISQLPEIDISLKVNIRQDEVNSEPPAINTPDDTTETSMDNLPAVVEDRTPAVVENLNESIKYLDEVLRETIQEWNNSLIDFAPGRSLEYKEDENNEIQIAYDGDSIVNSEPPAINTPDDTTETSMDNLPAVVEDRTPAVVENGVVTSQEETTQKNLPAVVDSRNIVKFPEDISQNELLPVLVDKVRDLVNLVQDNQDTMLTIADNQDKSLVTLDEVSDNTSKKVDNLTDEEEKEEIPPEEEQDEKKENSEQDKKREELEDKREKKREEKEKRKSKKDPMSGILALIASLFKKFSSLIGGIVGKGAGILKSLLPMLIVIFLPAILSLIAKVIRFVKQVIAKVKAAYNEFKSKSGGIISKVTGTVKSIWSAVKNKVSSIATSVSGKISSIFNAIKAKFAGIESAIKAKFASIKAGAYNLLGKLKNVSIGGKKPFADFGPDDSTLKRVNREAAEANAEHEYRKKLAKEGDKDAYSRGLGVEEVSKIFSDAKNRYEDNVKDISIKDKKIDNRDWSDWKNNLYKSETEQNISAKRAKLQKELDEGKITQEKFDKENDKLKKQKQNEKNVTDYRNFLNGRGELSDDVKNMSQEDLDDMFFDWANSHQMQLTKEEETKFKEVKESRKTRVSTNSVNDLQSDIESLQEKIKKNKGQGKDTTKLEENLEKLKKKKEEQELVRNYRKSLRGEEQMNDKLKSLSEEDRENLLLNYMNNHNYDEDINEIDRNEVERIQNKRVQEEQKRRLEEIEQEGERNAKVAQENRLNDFYVVGTDLALTLSGQKAAGVATTGKDENGNPVGVVDIRAKMAADKELERTSEKISELKEKMGDTIINNISMTQLKDFSPEA